MLESILKRIRVRRDKPLAIAVEAAGISDAGKVRTENQDRYGMCDLTRGQVLDRSESVHPLGRNGALFIIADGVGGLPGGGVASQIAVATLLNCFLKENHNHSGLNSGDVVARLRDGVAEAHATIRRLVPPDINGLSMSTTLIGALLRDSHLLLAHVGDSRAYLCREDRILQLTTDHTFVRGLMELGQITLEEAAERNDQNILVRAVGYGEHPKEDLLSVDLCQGDVLILCTDGIHGYVPDIEMRDLIFAGGTAEEICSRLSALANGRGGADNGTAIVVRIMGDALPPPAGKSIQVQAIWPDRTGNSAGAQ